MGVSDGVEKSRSGVIEMKKKRVTHMVGYAKNDTAAGKRTIPFCPL